MIEFKQGVEIAKHSSDKLDNEGVCWALSLKWLSLSLGGKSDEGVTRIGTLRAWVPDAIALQKRYREVHEEIDKHQDTTDRHYGATKAAALIEALGRNVNLQIDRSVRDQILMTMDSGLGNLDALVNRLATAGTGHMLSFQMKDSGHAMAVRARSSGFWHTFGDPICIFNPNGGETFLSKANTKTFLRNYFGSEGVKTLLIVKVQLRG